MRNKVLLKIAHIRKLKKENQNTIVIANKRDISIDPNNNLLK